MSKDVLISIRPRWVEKICHRIGEENGKPIYEKKIEARKTKPATPTPFKCFIYETHDKKYEDIGVCWGQCNTFEHACGKVIGEFVCDKIEDFYCASVPYKKENNLGYGRFVDNGVYKVNGWHEGIVFERNDRFIDSMLNNSDLKEMRLSAQELFDYIGVGKHLYAWHITDLKIYNKPKELREFRYSCPKGFNDMNNFACYREVGAKLKFCKYNDVRKKECDAGVKRPPQSWCFVEEAYEN